MPYPPGHDIELPLLKEIHDAGGDVFIRDRQIYLRVARYFPQLTDEELIRRTRASDTVWENRVQWARLQLVKQGELLNWRDVGRQGIWRITDRGVRRVMENQKYIEGILESARQHHAVADSLQPLDLPAELAIHSRIQNQVEVIGQILGKYAKREYRQDMYRYDVVWKDADYLPRATHCFEVQHKGNLVEALAKLKHAYDIWGSILILIITDEKDRLKASELLRPYFTGVFHEIGSATTVLTADDVGDIFDVFDRHQQTINQFTSR